MKIDHEIKRCFVAGHRGMVGSAVLRLFKKKYPFINIITCEKNELNLVNQEEVNKFLKIQKPNLVILAAARVGGIFKNMSYPAQFLYENLMIQNNVIHGCFLNRITKILFLGSSCIYPKFSNQPIKESELLTGLLEKTNEAYAIAKIAGIRMCQYYNEQYGMRYKALMPTNLFGEGDNYHPEESHVIPGLIRRFHDAKVNNDNEIKVWGTGNAYREFLYVDDLAEAILLIALQDNSKIEKLFLDKDCFINVGTGMEISINELAKKISKITGYKGKIVFDKSKPDGTPRKILDSTLINSIGWKPKITLEEGLEKTYKIFKSIEL